MSKISERERNARHALFHWRDGRCVVLKDEQWALVNEIADAREAEARADECAKCKAEIEKRTLANAWWQLGRTGILIGPYSRQGAEVQTRRGGNKAVRARLISEEAS